MSEKISLTQQDEPNVSAEIFAWLTEWEHAQSRSSDSSSHNQNCLGTLPTCRAPRGSCWTGELRMPAPPGHPVGRDAATSWVIALRLGQLPARPC